jgi:hypothetical protein
MAGAEDNAFVVEVGTGWGGDSTNTVCKERHGEGNVRVEMLAYEDVAVIDGARENLDGEIVRPWSGEGYSIKGETVLEMSALTIYFQYIRIKIEATYG